MSIEYHFVGRRLELTPCSPRDFVCTRRCLLYDEPFRVDKGLVESDKSLSRIVLPTFRSSFSLAKRWDQINGHQIQQRLW